MGNVVLRLVPRWGRGGAWQNPPCEFAALNRNSGYSYLGVPATAGMNDWYENDVTWPRDCPNATALQSTSLPALHRRILPSPRPMVDGGTENVVRGLVPRWGRGGAWQNPPRQFAVPSHNSSFSYLGVPAPAGMSDWYENALKPLSSAPLNPNIPRSRHSGASPFVIPAKAGIHALTSREITPTAIPPPTSTRRPHFVSPAIARPVPRYETGIERRCMGGK